MAMSSFSISTLRPSPPSLSSSSSSSSKLRTLVGTPTPPPGLVVECSSRPEKKATKHHMKTRPKKTQPWDIRRRPTAYAPLPPLPPDWTLVESSGQVAEPPAVVASSAAGGEQ